MTNESRLECPAFLPCLDLSKSLIIEYRNVLPHLEIGLEIFERWPVECTYVFAGHLLRSFDGYVRPPLNYKTPEDIALKYLHDNAINNQSLKLNSIPQYNPLLRSLYQQARDSVLAADTIQDLKRLAIDGHHYGLAIASEIISYSKSLIPDLTAHRNKSLILLSQYFDSFALAETLIQEVRPESLVVFNGRFSAEKALVDAGKKHSLDIFYHDKANNQERFFFAPYTPHDIPRRQSEILAALSDIKKTPSEDYDKYFADHRKGIGLISTMPYDQRIHKSAAHSVSSEPDTTTFLFCTSSEDEFASIETTNMYPGWGSQEQAVIQIARYCKTINARFILRVHPNIRTKALFDRQLWDSTCDAVIKHGGIAFSYNSSISTYDLVEKSSLVITAGSTIGIEALSVNKPCAVIRSCFYSNLPGLHLVQTLEELASIKLLPHHKHSSLSAARAFAHWSASLGVHHSFLRYDHRGILFFHDLCLRPWKSDFFYLLYLKRSLVNTVHYYYKRTLSSLHILALSFSRLVKSL